MVRISTYDHRHKIWHGLIPCTIFYNIVDLCLASKVREESLKNSARSPSNETSMSQSGSGSVSPTEKDNSNLICLPGTITPKRRSSTEDERFPVDIRDAVLHVLKCYDWSMVAVSSHEDRGLKNKPHVKRPMNAFMNNIQHTNEKSTLDRY